MYFCLDFYMICSLYISYIRVFAEIGGLELSFPGICIGSDSAQNLAQPGYTHAIAWRGPYYLAKPLLLGKASITWQAPYY